MGKLSELQSQVTGKKINVTPAGLPTANKPSMVNSPLERAQRYALSKANETPKVAEEKEEDKTALDRVSSGLKSIGNAWAGTLPLIGETTAIASKNLVTDLSNEDYRKKAQEAREWSALLDGLDENDPQYQVAKAKYDSAMKQVDAVRTNEAVDPNSVGMRLMRESAKQRAEATEGMSGAGKFLADTAIGLGQFTPVVAASVYNPAVGSVAAGALSSAQKMYEVQEAGGSAGEAFGRGLVSGAIETITEKIPLDTLMDVAKHGGKSAIKNILKQSGIEATEETISYIANLAADKAAGDENAQFSATDLGLSALGGALSGGVMSGAATGVNRLATSISNNKSTTTLPNVKPVETAVKAEEAATETKADNTVKNEILNRLDSGKRSYNGWQVSVYRDSQGDGATVTIYQRNGEKIKQRVNGGRYLPKTELNGIAADMIAKQVSMPLQNSNVAPEEASVGAAPAGFTGDTERGFSKNLASDKARHREVQHEYQVNPQKYFRLGNQETLGKATAIMDTGLDNAVSTLEQALGAAQAGKKFAPEMVPLSKMIGDELAAQGRIAEAERLLSAVAVELTEAGQLGQSAKILRDASPATRIQTVTGIVNKMNEKFKDKNISVDKTLIDQYANAKTPEAQADVLDEIYKQVAAQIPSTFIDQFNALRYLNMLGNIKTQARNVSGNATMTGLRIAKDKVGAVLEGIAKKATKGEYQPTKSLTTDKATRDLAAQDWQAHRDEALGEAKYSTRNGLPSAIYDHVTVFKNNGTWGTTENSALPVKAVRKTADVAKAGLEKARKITSWAMEKGDEVFSKKNYADALAGYLKANGISSEQFSQMLQSESEGKGTNEVLEKAREYAIKEAQKATFRDQNQISDLFAEIGFKNPDTDAKKAVNAALQGTLPFRRTPANVMARMVEYSPLGVVETAYKAAKSKKSTGSVDLSEVIDDLAANITGTGLFLIGMALQNAGKVIGGEDENAEQERLNDLIGEENYTIEIGGTNYTVDAVSPASVAVMMGAEFEKIREETDSDLAAALRAFATITNPILETSMLSGIRDAFDNISYAENGMVSMALNSLADYMSQGLTSTLGGQIERTFQDERISTYVDRTKDTGKETQYAIGSASAKVPGLDYNQIPYIDAWGRREESKSLPMRALENFVLPFYSSKTNQTEADKEIQRLLDAGQTGVVPQKPSQSVEVTYKMTPNSEKSMKKYLTPEEYVTYSEVKGQTSYDVVNEMLNSKVYAKMTDEEKAEAIQKAYKYATHLASEAVTKNKHVSDKYVKLAQTAKKELGLSEGDYLLLYQVYGNDVANGDAIRKAYADGVTPWEYAKYAVNATKRYDTDNSGGVTIAERKKAIEATNLSKEKQVALWKLAQPSWVKKAEEQGISFENFLKTKLSNY